MTANIDGLFIYMIMTAMKDIGITNNELIAIKTAFNKVIPTKYAPLYNRSMIAVNRIDKISSFEDGN